AVENADSNLRIPLQRRDSFGRVEAAHDGGGQGQTRQTLLDVGVRATALCSGVLERRIEEDSGRKGSDNPVVIPKNAADIAAQVVEMRMRRVHDVDVIDSMIAQIG